MNRNIFLGAGGEGEESREGMVRDEGSSTHSRTGEGSETVEDEERTGPLTTLQEQRLEEAATILPGLPCVCVCVCVCVCLCVCRWVRW